MRIKICGIRNQDDIKVVVRANADAAGFLVGQLHASPDFILPSTAARLVSMLPPYICPVLVTHLKTAEDILELVVKTGIYNLQLHGCCSLSEILKLKDNLPLNSKIMMSSYVLNNQCMPDLKEYYRHVDAILLDAFNQGPDEIIQGQDNSELSYKWEFAAEFVKTCPLPVILTGGLKPENVAQAIQTVKPFAVDANSRLKTDDGQARSPEKCINFVRNARRAGDEIQS